MEIGLSMLYYWAAYMAATIVGILHTIYFWKVLKIETHTEKGTKPSQSPAYLKTKPFHVLYNIMLFPIAAYLYLHAVEPANVWFEVFVLSVSWAVITILIDWIGWVLVKHPWSLSYREMYVGYQPWITLIYLVIFISPIVAALLFLNI